ncbi:HIT family protein [Patescibacteria group bacterium]|nr:HIT family protein [Patescibacteria group bacterium]
MCIFCQIIADEIPSYKIYEDEKILAFLDIKPVHPGHILVIPKKHAQNIEDVSEEDLTAVILGVKKMGKLIKNNLNYPSYNVIENNDSAAGQEIPHLHFHIIPRLENDGLNHWSHREYNPGEAEEILKKLKN